MLDMHREGYSSKCFAFVRADNRKPDLPHVDGKKEAIQITWSLQTPEK